MKILLAKIKFIQMIIDGSLDFKNKNRQAIKKDLTIHFEESIIETLIKMPIYSLCQDELQILCTADKEQQIEIQEWKAIDTTKEFIKELKTL